MVLHDADESGDEDFGVIEVLVARVGGHDEAGGLVVPAVTPRDGLRTHPQSAPRPAHPTDRPPAKHTPTHKHKRENNIRSHTTTDINRHT